MFDDDGATVAIAIRDATYLLDFVQDDLTAEGDESLSTQIVDYVLNNLRKYSEERLEKFIGLAMPTTVAKKCPTLCSKLWAELDIIPLVLPEESSIGTDNVSNHPIRKSTGWEIKSVDEQSESMGRKCVRCAEHPFSLCF